MMSMSPDSTGFLTNLRCICPSIPQPRGLVFSILVLLRTLNISRTWSGIVWAEVHLALREVN